MSEPIRDLGSSTPAGRRARYELVILAASAGGLQAIRRVLATLPPEFSTPIAVLLHRTPEKSSRLAEILARSCSFPVHTAIDGEGLLAGTVYVAPPDVHLLVDENRRLRLEDGRRINFLRSSAEPLLRSAAHALHGRVIAVVLTGGGSNGAAAVRDVKALGGTVIAQDEATSQCWGMPRAAIETGAVDLILPLDEIAPTLTKLTMNQPDSQLAPATA